MKNLRFFNSTELHIQKSVQSSSVHANGSALELRVQRYLESMGIPHIKGKSNGIDFIINGSVYLECKAQTVNGSICEKLPTCAFKYIEKYDLNGGDIYFLHPYSSINIATARHFELLENVLNTKIHVLDWKDFTYLMNGGVFKERKPYRIGKDGGGNYAPTNFKINEFFKFQNK